MPRKDKSAPKPNGPQSGRPFGSSEGKSQVYVLERFQENWHCALTNGSRWMAAAACICTFKPFQQLRRYIGHHHNMGLALVAGELVCRDDVLRRLWKHHR